MNFIVTMIAPSRGGAGDYLEEVRNQFEDFLLISPINLKFSNELVNTVFIVFQRIILKFIILLLLPFIKLDKLIVYHPQTLGYWFSSYLIKNASSIFYFVLDSSIFCIKSYNHRNNIVCTHCIDKISPFADCNFFPRNNSIKRFMQHREVINLELHKIEFVVQTDGYKNIVKSVFGQTARIRLLKMKFPSIKRNNFQSSEKKYDFVFHGNNLDAKGSSYALNMAKSFSCNKFFFPFHIDSKKKNIVSKPLSWDKGLKQVISKSKISLCPSIWSAPVEGAIIKTMLLKVPVAIHVNEYSASNTLFPKDSFIPLTGNIYEDLIILQDYLNDDEKLLGVSNKAFEWVNDYING